MSRILFITNSIGFGGAEKILTFVANQLSLRGHICSIINLNSTEDYLNIHKQEINDSIQVYNIDLRQGCKNRRLFHITEIKKIAEESRAEVLIGFTGFPNLYAKTVGSIMNIPSIMSERGDPNRTNGKNGLKESIVLSIINRSRGGVFQTDGAKYFYGNGLQKRGIVIPNPVFIKGIVPYVERVEREKTIVSVGRLDNEQKRYDIMLKAFRLFSIKYPDYILKLYGKGTDEEQIYKWVDELEINNKVRFMGLTTQPMQDIAKDGIFLITSDYEGISNALLEAMAVGLPCVSTDHTPGGARLLIQDHENGLLTPVGDVEKLATALFEFAENPSLAEKCGENARNVINRFEPSRIINMWEEYIEKCLDKTKLKRMK